MRRTFLVFLPAATLIFAGSQGEAMPISPASVGSPAAALTLIADACGPGLVRGRLGTCLKRRAVFSHGRIVRKGCGKPIGAAGLRTPC